MGTVYLVGHQNPDTDSICSSIAYANFKSLVQPSDAFVPARLGPLNKETEFVLEYFRAPAPVLLEHVYAQVEDVVFDQAVAVSRDTSMRRAWELMARTGVKTVNVVDDGGRLSGIITLGDIAEAYFRSGAAHFRDPLSVVDIAGTLDGQVLVPGPEVFSGTAVVGQPAAPDAPHDGGGGPAALAGAAGRPPGPSHHEMLIIWDGREVEVPSSLKFPPGLRVLVIAGRRDTTPEASPGLLEAAGAASVAVISTPHPVYEAVRLVGQSLPVSRVMTAVNLVTFHLDDLVDDAKETMLRYKYRNFPILDDQGRPAGMLSRRHILDYFGKKVILVDHNEKSQSVEGIEQATVLEIIDHHRIATVETDQPIVFLNRPLGCTATIIHDLFRQKGLVPGGQVAGLMCAAILSDTLAFRSPTCTGEDVKAAEELAGLAGMDMEEFAKFMFEAGTSLEGKTEKDIFHGDFKEFRVGGFRIGVSQVNIYNTHLGALKPLLLDFMEEERAGKGYDILMLMLTDIIDEGTEFLVAGNKDLVERGFGVEITGNRFFLKGVISRKKQVVPRIIRAINSL